MAGGAVDAEFSPMGVLGAMTANAIRRRCSEVLESVHVPMAGYAFHARVRTAEREGEPAVIEDSRDEPIRAVMGAGSKRNDAAPWQDAQVNGWPPAVVRWAASEKPKRSCGNAPPSMRLRIPARSACEAIPPSATFRRLAVLSSPGLKIPPPLIHQAIRDGQQVALQHLPGLGLDRGEAPLLPERCANLGVRVQHDARSVEPLDERKPCAHGARPPTGCIAGAGAGAGSRRVKVLPPGPVSLSSSVPPWDCAIQRAIERPSPAPLVTEPSSRMRASSPR
jgi:hypothetical protein